MLRVELDSLLDELNSFAKNAVSQNTLVRIGRHTVKISSNSSTSLDKALHSVIHPDPVSVGQIDYEIFIIDRRELPNSKLKLLNYGFYRDKTFLIEILAGDNTIHVQDKKAYKSFYVYRDLGQIPTDDGSNSRRLLAPAYSSLGYVALHGSVIEFENRGYLFSGPSGVGKSTIAARLILEGCSTVGDDFFLCHTSEPLRAIAISKSLKMAPQNQLLGAFSKKHENQFNNGEKVILDISNSIKRSIEISCVLLPDINLAEESKSVTFERVLEQILPTSMLLNLTPSKVIKHVETFFPNLPRYEVLSGSIDSDLLRRFFDE